MKRLAATCLAVGALTAGCGITSGTVVGKAHDAESTVYVWQCMAYDAKSQCSFRQMVPYTTPECWRLDLADGGSTGDVCVPEAEWRKYAEGSRYP